MKIENYNYEKSDVSFLIVELYILLIKFQNCNKQCQQRKLPYFINPQYSYYSIFPSEFLNDVSVDPF